MPLRRKNVPEKFSIHFPGSSFQFQWFALHHFHKDAEKLSFQEYSILEVIFFHIF